MDSFFCREGGLTGEMIDLIADMDVKIEIGYKKVLAPENLRRYGASTTEIISNLYRHVEGCKRCKSEYEDSLSRAREFEEDPY